MFCSICLNKINKNDEFINNECCNNTFHNKCLTEWYKIKENCPLCRKNNEIIKKSYTEKLDNVNNILTIFNVFLKINK